jgi:hypothetical protein
MNTGTKGNPTRPISGYLDQKLLLETRQNWNPKVKKVSLSDVDAQLKTNLESSFPLQKKS